jgi:hypothetical protein
LLVVFDDAVVDERNFAGLVEVRVGVGVGRRAVRGPASVADANAAFGRLLAQDASQVVDTTSLLAEFEGALIEDADAGGIVTAVFQTTESLEKNVLGGFTADVADDATHVSPHVEVARPGFNRPDRCQAPAALANHDSVDFECFCFFAADEKELTTDDTFCQLTAMEAGR